MESSDVVSGSSEPGYVIGIDGGGTKSVGCLARFDGRIEAVAVGAPSNYQVLGAGRVRAALEPLVDRLLGSAEVARQDVAAAVFALSGCGRSEDRDNVRQALQAEPALLPRVRVEHDGMAALAGAFGRSAGIILISGTGVLCLGRSPDGREARAGGWGYLLGDEGSGFYVGQQGLIAALKAFDGRGPKTVLQQKFEEHFGIEAIDRVVPIVYRKPMDRGDFAALAPLVFDAAAEGDQVAQEIVRRNGRELGLLVRAVVQRLGLTGETVRLAVVGNVFRALDWLKPDMEAELLAVVRSLEVVTPRFEPVIGAVILALEEAAGEPPNEDVLRTLEETQARLASEQPAT